MGSLFFPAMLSLCNVHAKRQRHLHSASNTHSNCIFFFRQMTLFMCYIHLIELEEAIERANACRTVTQIYRHLQP